MRLDRRCGIGVVLALCACGGAASSPFEIASSDITTGDGGPDARASIEAGASRIDAQADAPGSHVDSVTPDSGSAGDAAVGPEASAVTPPMVDAAPFDPTCCCLTNWMTLQQTDRGGDGRGAGCFYQGLVQGERVDLVDGGPGLLPCCGDPAYAPGTPQSYWNGSCPTTITNCAQLAASCSLGGSGLLENPVMVNVCH